jgi:deoxyribonuclease-4
MAFIKQKETAPMLHIGCHLSSSDGFLAMGETALSLQADTFQFFTRNPRGSKAKAIDPADAAALCRLLEEHRFAKLIAHAPYTLNPCSGTESTRDFARQTMADDLRRMEFVPGQYYNFHPGSHVGQGAETGIRLITETLNGILTPDQTTTVLLETMAGKGSEVGGRFEELRAIIDGVTLSEKVGVCLDTCHVSDAGYDIIRDLDGVLAEFDRVIGIDRLKAVHLNDSKNPPASHKDRHERIGQGCIGLEALTQVVRHPLLRDLPFCLETPNDLPGYAAEIALLRQAAE